MLHPLSQKIKSIKSDLKKSLDSGATPIAAFDADGTLWRRDVGELFFEYQIHNQLVELPAEPLKYYFDLLKSHSDGRGYLWLAQINKGKSLTQVRAWAKSCIEEALASSEGFPVFDEQKELIEFLKSEKVAVYIVSASVKWAVEPAAALFGIPFENVLGIQTVIESGKVTDVQAGALTWKPGKVTALKEACDGRAPFFCSGNSEGDLSLLQFASAHRLVIASALPSESNYPQERRMQDLAKKNGWWNIDYSE